MEKEKKICDHCGGSSFVEGTDFMNIRPLNKKLSKGSEKIYRFCTNCGYVKDVRISNPEKFK